MITPKNPVSRRKFLTATAAFGAAGLAAPALAQGIDPYTGQPLQGTAGGATPDAGLVQVDQTQDSRRNISSFRMQDWQPYFSNLTNGAILVDLTSRALHFWSEDQSVYKLYPTSVPVSPDLTRKALALAEMTHDATNTLRLVFEPARPELTVLQGTAA